MPANTSAASASCDTHFGLTKLVASIVRRPVADSRSISSIFAAVGTIAFSFCSPSRGPTSTMRTLAGSATSLTRHAEERAGFGVEQPGSPEHLRRLHAGEPVVEFVVGVPDFAGQIAVDDRVRRGLVIDVEDVEPVAVDRVAHQHDVPVREAMVFAETLHRPARV